MKIAQPHPAHDRPGPRVRWRLVMEWLVAWWDGFELWLVQLPYPLLVTLMLVVLLPLCWSVAWVVDRGVDAVSAKVTGMRDAELSLDRQERPDESRKARGTAAGDRDVR